MYNSKLFLMLDELSTAKKNDMFCYLQDRLNKSMQSYMHDLMLSVTSLSNTDIIKLVKKL